MAATGHLHRWTRYFTVGSTAGLVGVSIVQLLGIDRLTTALIAIFGFVCPMVFGMAYLLVPSYAGRTLVNQRLPGVHFGCAFGGATLFVTGFAADCPRILVAGALLWAVGVTIFVGSLVWTVVPAVVERPESVLRSESRPQRSTRLGTAMIPVAFGYLLLGTVALIGYTKVLSAVGPIVIPAIIHYYAAGFAALLVFALGVRLLTGFFHESPSDWLARLVLIAGGIGPGLLVANFGGGHLFRLAAAMEATALVGYAVLVSDVARRTSRPRVGLYGILLGGMIGAAAAGVALAIAFGRPAVARLDAHAVLLVNGFFPLTITGYAYQFFAVPAGRFVGAKKSAIVSSFGCLGGGAVLEAGGYLLHQPRVRFMGSVGFLIGSMMYLYLIGLRLLGDESGSTT